MAPADVKAVRDELRAALVDMDVSGLWRCVNRLDALLQGAGRLQEQSDLLSDMRQHIQHRWVAQPDKIEDWYWAVQGA
jgi:hypothetical protein